MRVKVRNQDLPEPGGRGEDELRGATLRYRPVRHLRCNIALLGELTLSIFLSFKCVTPNYNLESFTYDDLETVVVVVVVVSSVMNDD